MPPPSREEIVKRTEEFLSSPTLARKFSGLHRVDKEIRKLDEHLVGKGFKAQEGTRNFWGTKATYENRAGKKAVFTLSVQDYSKPGSKDQAAVGQYTLEIGDRTETQSFSLIAPRGVHKDAKEYFVKGLEVAEANSWWSCVKGQLSKVCASICIAALTSCTGSWSAYLACVAAACGGCFVKAAACCGCNCSWWCKWAVGCCRR